MKGYEREFMKNRNAREIIALGVLCAGLNVTFSFTKVNAVIDMWVYESEDGLIMGTVWDNDKNIIFRFISDVNSLVKANMYTFLVEMKGK